MSWTKRIVLIGLATFSFPLYSALPGKNHGANRLKVEEDNPIYVGVIEDDRRQLDRLGPKDVTPVSSRTITPTFEKDGSDWKAIQSLNRETVWTIAFDGKKIGEVKSSPVSAVTSEETTGPKNVHSILTPLSEIPTVGKLDGRFSGNYGRDTRRPLVVVSQPNFTDPDQWKPKEAPSQLIGGVHLKVRTVLNHVRKCDSSGEALKTDWNYPDSEVMVVKSYGSNKGEFILETKFRNNHCLFNVNGNDYQSLGGNQVFYVGAKHEVIFLGLQWELVDAGDYDRDGRSEVIFYVAEGKDIDVESEGYILFYDDFRRSVRFTWKNE